MSSRAFEQACHDLGVGHAIPLFHRYLELVVEGNQWVNIVGRSQSLERLYHHHLLDSLLVMPRIKPHSIICDVGSGGGFPALCWALSDASLKIYLVEKSPKKCKFLTQAISQLDLAHRVVVLPSRVQDVDVPATLVTCRALTDLTSFLEITQHLARPDVTWWLLKGQRESIDREIQEFAHRNRYDILIHQLQHPTEDLSRHLVEVHLKAV